MLASILSVLMCSIVIVKLLVVKERLLTSFEDPEGQQGFVFHHRSQIFGKVSYC
jgi:hypothetical protein